MMSGAANGAPFRISDESTDSGFSDLAEEKISGNDSDDSDNSDFDPTNCAYAPWRSLVIRC